MSLRPLTALTILTVSTLFGALTAQAAELPRDCYQSLPGYELQMFREQENQMKSWNQIHNNSSYGSARQREADIRRRAHGRAALDMLQAPGGLIRQPHGVVSDLANEMVSRTNNTSYGSFINEIYREAQTIALRIYVEKGMENLRCETLSGEEALRGAKTYQSLENNSSYGSAKNEAYRQLRQDAFEQASLKLEQELRYGGLDVRTLQEEGSRYTSLENNSSYGSSANELYRRLKLVAYQVALDTLRGQLNYLSSYDLMNLERDFESRQRNSSYGSAKSEHFRLALSLVREELNRRAYQPIPTPPPHNPMPHYPVPYPHPPRPVPVPVPPPHNPRPVPPAPNRCPDPNTHYDARIGRCVANR